MQNAKVLNAFFISVFTRKVRSEKDLPSVEDRGHLKSLNRHKSMGPDGCTPNLADVIERPLFIILEMSWQLEVVPGHWKKAHGTPIFKKGKEEDPSNYRQANLPSVSGKLIEQIILRTFSRHLKDGRVIRRSQQFYQRLVSPIRR